MGLFLGNSLIILVELVGSINQNNKSLNNIETRLDAIITQYE